ACLKLRIHTGLDQQAGSQKAFNRLDFPFPKHCRLVVVSHIPGYTWYLEDVLDAGFSIMHKDIGPKKRCGHSLFTVTPLTDKLLYRKKNFVASALQVAG